MNESVTSTLEIAADTFRSFLETEITAGLTFARVAMCTEANLERAIRNRANARKAYDTVVRSFGTMKLTQSAAEKICTDLAVLRSQLEKLGESLE
jgi:hypothetical protein